MEKDLSNYLIKIDDIYSKDNLKIEDYEAIIEIIINIISIKDYHILIDDKDLESLEIIQIESYLKVEKYMDGFLNLGKFKKIDYFVSNLLI